MNEKVVMEREIAGKKLIIETGTYARQANGAALVRYEDTAVLVTAVCSDKPREGIDFFPLMVDYEEKLYAAGKIPGGFIKREGRPSEKSILTSRLIDRPIRPLFPEGIRNDIQIVALVLSADQKNDSDIPAIIGASAALAVSDIPFPDLIGAARVAHVEGEFIINPTYEQRNKSLLDLVVVGTREHIVMVEAGAEETPEELVLDALKVAHENIREIIGIIEELVAKAGKTKLELPMYEPDKDLEVIVRENLTEKINTCMRICDKAEREDTMLKLKDEALMHVMTKVMGDKKEALISLLSDERNMDFSLILQKVEEEEFRKMIVDEKKRPDGRCLDEVRSINCDVGILPRTHGSGLFSRGETQVLTILTLGMVSEEQILDGLGGGESKRYMHQYNFPSFSVGEVKPMRGPGRREIGHGALAERALVRMIPPEAEFPYALRLVSEVLESNGSTSMASTCASTLALMDAGVKIKKTVAGIAMGLVTHGEGYAILTDIQGMEDHLGDMDFKVAGTRDGITALQMDIKIRGLTFEIFEKALAQAREARLFILDKINECISAPREELSPYAPRIIIMMISPDKIKDVIGPGGKMINKIIAETGVKIDIEDDGRVFIAAVDPEAGVKARKWIEDITREVEVGAAYLGRVSRIMNFGAFVEILPGKEGLVHISRLASHRVNRVEDVVNIGDELPVKVTEIDDQGRINLSAVLTSTAACEDEERSRQRRSSRPPRPGQGDRRRPERGPSRR